MTTCSVHSEQWAEFLSNKVFLFSISCAVMQPQMLPSSKLINLKFIIAYMKLSIRSTAVHMSFFLRGYVCQFEFGIYDKGCSTFVQQWYVIAQIRETYMFIL